MNNNFDEKKNKKLIPTLNKIWNNVYYFNFTNFM